MRILSIDVGMRNLAVCIIETSLPDSHKISFWEVLDLCETPEYKCKEIMNNKAVCNKNARFFKGKKYYCKLHGKKQKYKMPTNELIIKRLKKRKIKDIKSIAQKYDLSFNMKDKKDILMNNIILDLSNNYLNFVEKSKTQDFTLLDYGKSIKNIFDKTFLNMDIDYVLIENQIGPLALRMKSIQAMLIQYFIDNDITNIECISSSNKLKEFIGNKDTSYKERKKYGIEFTNKILLNDNNLNKWLQTFNAHKKKDDLADCYLQARWFIKNKLKV
tara:strand:+ start:2776 stop:3594 length:819 start_codon:yes stop_codon:yes gene_type:complete